MTTHNTDREELYYITHIKNVPSILRHGILSHNECKRQGREHVTIYDESIVARRRDKQVGLEKLGDFANVFFKVRNAMLYRVVSEAKPENVAVLSLDAAHVMPLGAYVTDGNAAHGASSILPMSKLKEVRKRVGKYLEREFWADADGSKRVMMAEVLVRDRIPPSAIKAIYVAKAATATALAEEFKKQKMPFDSRRDVVRSPDLFFLYNMVSTIGNVKILVGDMFFSRLQTLTVSVNTKGIMGKGVASRARWQFPDVYNEYQIACRKGQLALGKPFLYKRQSSILQDLKDEFDPADAAKQTWFLLFATKDDWKYPAIPQAIYDGLRWLEKNAKKEGIESLALPALGCGLGKLSWDDVGPMMIQSLTRLGMPVEIYLPLDHEDAKYNVDPNYLRGHDFARALRVRT